MSVTARCALGSCFGPAEVAGSIQSDLQQAIIKGSHKSRRNQRRLLAAFDLRSFTSSPFASGSVPPIERRNLDANVPEHRGPLIHILVVCENAHC
jgi:hypothetical protein